VLNSGKGSFVDATARDTSLDGSGQPAPQATGRIEVAGVHKSFGGPDVLCGVALAVEPGRIVALLGPSGCGKTTLLRCIAGLERVDVGDVWLTHTRVSGPRTHVPPERRRIGMVFQDWALFPHLTVAQNVAYGLTRQERKEGRVTEALAMVGLEGLGDRRPATLSGGQQQRVALARALAPRPRVLLLDEPFSNLDTALRVQVRTEVHQLLAELGVTTVFVTHDQEEAFVLGDEVAVMHEGRVVQQASPAELYARPATPWVARFIGDANLVPATAAGQRAVTPVGEVPLERAMHGDVQVLLRPEELLLRPESGHASPTAHADPSTVTLGFPTEDSAGGVAGVSATVELREYYGHDTVYVVRPDAGWPLRARAGSVPQFGRGDRVMLSYVGPPALAFATDRSQEPALSTVSG
jgi:iron(III) transport system ATP-binding protein